MGVAAPITSPQTHEAIGVIAFGDRLPRTLSALVSGQRIFQKARIHSHSAWGTPAKTTL